MTATTTDRAITWYPDGQVFPYPVYTAVKIPAGTLVSLNSSGYAVKSTDAAETFVGVAEEMADNTSGASGAISVKVRRRGVCTMITTGAGLTSPGTDMYCTDNQTVQTTANNLYVGKFVRYTSATECELDISAATCGIPAPEDTDETVSLPVYRTTTITIGDLVYTRSDGYAVGGAAYATAGLHLEGIANATANNSSGSDGDINVSVKRATDPVTHLTTTGAAITDIGKLVWAAGAQAVSLTPGENLAGVITKYVNATSVYVSLLPALDKPRPGTGDLKCLYFTSVSVANVNVTTALEFPRKALVKRLYATCVTAPAGSDTLTASITDGTHSASVVITGSATENEDEAPSCTLSADTNCTVNFTRTGSTAATGHLWVWYELL